MAITYSYSFSNDIVTKTAKIKDGSSVDDYIIGVHGKVTAKDDSDGAEVSRSAIFEGTKPDTKEASDFVEFSKVSGVPDGVKATAEALIKDDTLKAQMEQDIIDSRNAAVTKDAPW